MYEEHFGLNSRPFGVSAEGKNVFVGPGQSKQITRLQRGLALGDSVAAVTGEVGVGKTTAVSRALETIENGRVVISIGRMQIEPHELMALLLAGFGVSGHIKGTVRKFAAFKRLLIERKATVAPVAIVVEEAQKIGVDVLAELEALTAADAGDGACANIILMGQASLNEFLKQPDLARLNQRVRLRQEIEPLTAAEVQGYLKHCIREAGGNYDLIFDNGVAEIVHQCSGGIPRVINNVCEAAMTAAMDDHSAQVTTALIAQVAAETLGYEPAAAPEEVLTESDVTSSQSEFTENSDDDSIADVAPSRLEPAETQSSSESEPPSLPSEEDSVTPAEKDPVTPASKEDDIDWDAIAPPALAAKADKRKPTAIPAPTPAYQPEMIIESGNHPNIDDVISGAAVESKKTQPSQDRVAETASSEAEPMTETDTLSEYSGAPEFAASDVPHLIDDTQPELRELPDITDEASLAIDVPPLPAAAEADKAESSSEEAGIESTQNLETLDPELVSADENVEFDDADSTEHNNDKSLVVDAEALAETYSTDAAPAKSAPEPDVVPDADKQSNEQQPAITAEAAKPSAPEVSESKPVNVVAADESEADDTSVDSSVELPTLSDSMRVATQAEQSQAKSVNDNEGNATKPTLNGQADEVQATAADLEPAKEIDSEPVDAAVHAENDLPAASVDENDIDTGIFDQLDPLPEFDENGDVAVQAADDSAEPPFTDDDGAISVPDLTIANNFDKSRNDIDALEAALEAAKQGKISAPPPINDDASVDLNGSAALTGAEPIENTDAVDVPEITLDDELSKQQKNQPDLEQLAHEIGTAESLEDFSASMAETLFGNEAFAQIAAEVTANPPTDDDGSVAVEQEVSPVQLDESDIPSAANDTSEQSNSSETSPTNATSNFLLALEEEPQEAAPNVAATPTPPAAADAKVAVNPEPAEVSLEDTAALRLDILTKAAAKVADMAIENVELGESKLVTTSDGMDSPKPESIENQITTSHTQNLEALSVAKIAEMEKAEQEEEQKKSGGFFSRFRKSS